MRRELESSTSLPAQQQRLVYAQQHLETTGDLSDYYIVNRATIHAMLLPEGHQPFFYMDESLLETQTMTSISEKCKTEPIKETICTHVHVGGTRRYSRFLVDMETMHG